MTQVYADATYDASALIPTLFEPMVQVPLYKSLVGLEVCNVHDLPVGGTIRIRRFGDMSAKTYTPGTTISGTAQDWAYDDIVVTTYKYSSFYNDDVRKQLIDIDTVRSLASDCAYQIKNKIDGHIFANLTGADGFVNYQADASTFQGGTAHRPVSAGSANIINVFANAKKLLLQNNVEQMGDWCAIVTPTIGSYIDIKAASSGYNVADSTLRNGYAGDFLGFEVYISNNLPSGKCSSIAATISGGAVSATSCKSIFFGRKRMIELYLQPPRLSVRPKDDMIGTNYITYTTYGSGIVTKNRSRGLNVAVQSGYY